MKLNVLYFMNGKECHGEIYIHLAKLEQAKFKQQKEIKILVDKKDHQNISIDWDWLGRAPLLI